MDKKNDFPIYRVDIAPKINLGLHITGKRSDGYHNIQTCFYRVPLSPNLFFYDSLSVSVSETDDTTLDVSGNFIECDKHENLCYKAWKYAVNQYGNSILPLHINLLKRIPVGAGLGGGSANAAAILDAIGYLFSPDDWEKMSKIIACKLGADVTFFLGNNFNPKICMDDIGNNLQDVLIENFDNNYSIEIQFPEIFSSTRLAYEGINFSDLPINRKRLDDLLKLKPELWIENIQNDFEDSIFKKFPKIESLKKKFYERGAIYASMSGSGSAVYGIFNKRNK